MANSYATNYTTPSSTSVFKGIWRLTRAMKAAGWTTKAHSNGTTKISAGTNLNDSWGNNTDPTLDVYPTAFDTVVAWIVMSGPVTLKIPINGLPTGAPLRGETVTQSATSFEGELFGYVWDTVGSTGYMVIGPRVGTPNTSTAIIGSTSGGSFSPTGTIVTYNREVAISKVAADTVTGTINYICADGYSESAQLYSVLATSTGCTATVPPSCGGTGNTFPAKGITIRGTGGNNVGDYFVLVGSGLGTIAQIACANNITSTGITADGSFYFTIVNNGISTSSTTETGLMYTKMDDGEPGDVDPYIWLSSQANVYTSWNRIVANTSGGSNATFDWVNFSSGTIPCFSGYQARGITAGSRDVAAGYGGTAYGTNLSSFGSVSYALVANYPSPPRTLSHPATTPPLMREPLLVYAPGTTSGTKPQYKGRARWIFLYGIGSRFDTYDNKIFYCVTSATNVSPAVAIGPYDGSTTPTG